MLAKLVMVVVLLMLVVLGCSISVESPASNGSSRIDTFTNGNGWSFCKVFMGAGFSCAISRLCSGVEGMLLTAIAEEEDEDSTWIKGLAFGLL